MKTFHVMSGASIPTVAMLMFISAISASAAEFPDRPIRLIVGFAPGGGTDSTARAMSGKLGELLGQQVIVDNRAGAGGNIATEMQATATPDGYTILLATMAGLAINPTLYGKRLKVDIQKDLVPVARAVNTTNIVVVHPSVPARSIQELITLAKSKPATLNYGSAGVGGVPHLAAELFNSMAGVKITHVPYKGGGPAGAALFAGEVQVAFVSAASSIPSIRAGRIRALALTNSSRTELFPELPTLSEAGLAGYEVDSWYGFVSTARTSASVIARLNRDIGAALQAPEVNQMLSRIAQSPAFSTPAQFGELIRGETRKWAKVIAETGASAE